MVVGWISAENVGHFEEKMKIWKGAQEDDRQKGRRRVTIRYRVITLGGYPHWGDSVRMREHAAWICGSPHMLRSPDIPLAHT